MPFSTTKPKEEKSHSDIPGHSLAFRMVANEIFPPEIVAIEDRCNQIYVLRSNNLYS